MTAVATAPVIPDSIAKPDAPVTPLAPATPDWRASLPDDLKAEPSLASIADVAGLAKGYVHAQKMVGAEKLVIPGKDAKPEEMAAFYNKLGRPDTPDGYELPKENMPDIPLNESLLKRAFNEFHAMGISKQNAAALVRMQANMAAEQMKEQQAQSEAAIKANIESVRKEWGNAFEQNERLATLAVITGGGEELLNLLKQHPQISTNPIFLKAMAKLGRDYAEDEIKGGGRRQSFAMTPAEADAAILMKKGDKEFMAAYTDAGHHAHGAAVAEMNRLYQAKNPEQAT